MQNLAKVTVPEGVAGSLRHESKADLSPLLRSRCTHMTLALVMEMEAVV